MDYADLGMLLEEATIDEPIRRILWRCLELEHPELRPANAGLLQAELEQVAPHLRAKPCLSCCSR